MKHNCFLLFLMAILFSCQNNSSPQNNQGEGTEKASAVQDGNNADLWAYLYSHEFLKDSLVMTFSGDKVYIDDIRAVDALVVSSNEEMSASLVGVNPQTGSVVKLAVIRDGVNHSVVDLTNPNNIVFYFEKVQD